MRPLSHRKRLRGAEKWRSVRPCQRRAVPRHLRLLLRERADRAHARQALRGDGVRTLARSVMPGRYSSQFSRGAQMAVNALRIRRLELIDGQIRHIKPHFAIRPSITQELATAICAPLGNCVGFVEEAFDHSETCLSETTRAKQYPVHYRIKQNTWR